ARIQAVTAQDVQRVVRKYFTPENRCVATYTRKSSGGEKVEDPDLAGLTPDQQPVIRQIMGMLAQETSAARLRGMLEQMQASSESDPKKRQFQDIVRKKVEARLAELEK